MNRCRIRLSDGTFRDLASGEVVPDGATLVTSVLLKDEDQDRDRDLAREAYEQMKRDLARAHRSPGAQPEPELAATPAEAYERMKHDLANAWRRPAR